MKGGKGGSTARPARKFRCAIYTRKSTEEGLEQEFNSLHAQREAGSLRRQPEARGLDRLPDRYDDGGFTGGTLERPALKRLLRDVEAGMIDVRGGLQGRPPEPLADGLRQLVEVFDRHSVTFVSVTQQFNTTTSMGRLTLNILLSFAQFEREVIGERIRDKFAASRRRACGRAAGRPSATRSRTWRLVVVEREAALVRRIFDRFAKTGSALTVARELNAAGEVTKRRTVRRWDPRWQAMDQGRRLQGARQPGLPRRGSAQGRRLPGRARCDH